MPKVVVSRIISAPQQAIWNTWSDFGNIDKFHPAVKTSTIIGSPKDGKGAMRQCEFYDGSSIKERITVHNPLSAIGWMLTTPPGPIKRGDALVELQPRGPSETIATFTLTFTMKMGPVGWLLGNLVVKRVMKKTLNQLLQGLDDHLRTGQRVGKDGLLQAA